jgi:hypothetical protein
MAALRAVVMGPVEDRDIIGYVDDLGGVYSAQQRRLGGVAVERDGRYPVQNTSGAVVGSVDAAPNEQGGHAVYDPLNRVVGTAYATTFVEAATARAGLIAAGDGQDSQPEITAGAALLLLSTAAPGMTAPADAGAYSSGIAHLAQEGYQRLKEDHAQTLVERQRLEASGKLTDNVAAQRMKFLATVLVEMIPLGLGPWGLGDLITLLESIAGRTLDGLRLSKFERLIYLGASAIPVVPARPVVTVYRMLERGRAHEASGGKGPAQLPSPRDLNPLDGLQ